MKNKENFIKLVEYALSCMEVHPVLDGSITDEEYQAGLKFLQEFKEEEKEIKLTDNGKSIINHMKSTYMDKNKYTANSIGSEIFLSGRSVSGSIRKLVTEGFVEKIGVDPVTYALTQKGIDFIVE